MPAEALNMTDYRNETDVEAPASDDAGVAASLLIGARVFVEPYRVETRIPRSASGLDSELRADSNGLVARILVAESTSLRESPQALVDHLTSITDVNRCQRGFGWFERDATDGHLYLTRRFASVDTDFAHVLIGLRLLVRAAKRWSDYVTIRSLRATA